MFPPLILAAATTIAAQFFHDFGGSWSCGNDKYHSEWSIASPDGNYWTIVTYGIDPQHPGGAAYVGWLPQDNVYAYNDYHNDGSFAQLTAPPPIKGVWHWTGKYYAAGSKSVDRGADITWTAGNGEIQRKFAKRMNGKLVPMGSDTCVMLKRGEGTHDHFRSPEPSPTP